MPRRNLLARQPQRGPRTRPVDVHARSWSIHSASGPVHSEYGPFRKRMQCTFTFFNSFEIKTTLFSDVFIFEAGCLVKWSSLKSSNSSFFVFKMFFFSGRREVERHFVKLGCTAQCTQFVVCLTDEGHVCLKLFQNKTSYTAVELLETREGAEYIVLYTLFFFFFFFFFFQNTDVSPFAFFRLKKPNGETSVFSKNIKIISKACAKLRAHSGWH